VWPPVTQLCKYSVNSPQTAMKNLLGSFYNQHSLPHTRDGQAAGQTLLGTAYSSQLLDVFLIEVRRRLTTVAGIVAQPAMVYPI
jgi:hypothetical protein